MEGMTPKRLLTLGLAGLLVAPPYLAAAIDYVEEGMWNDPEYLESIRHALMLKLSSPQ
jgi:hypothetical protein